MIMKNFILTRTNLTISACMILLISIPAPANDFQSLASIRMQVEAYIMEYPYESPYPPRFKLGNLDSRLRLKACPQDLSVTFARSNVISGNTAVQIRCEQKSGWKIHLPVSIELFDDVLVAAKPLLKGQYIDNSAVRLQKQNIVRLKNGYFARDSNLDQLAARRNLVPGTVLTATNVSARLLVRSGQKVNLVLDYNGMQIRSTGEALQSASLGEVVKVRNTQSRKIVEGIVSAEGQVRIKL